MVVYRKETNDLDPITGNTAAQSIDDTANEGEKNSNAASLLAPRAILTARPNSHPFQERHIVLDQPAKIGRSVVRCRGTQNNAIFDCKVLSRNHALLWYENGKFYLQDTKSSNGTFINNQRLSKGSEESPAREVCSGDIVQFGVDVVENSRKVVHGCVVATLRLFLPDGKEAKASPTTAVVLPCFDASVSSQELYQLAQCLQEALHREQVLESKLGTLQKVVANTQDEADVGWKALIEEDRLLSRIETLESQLHTSGKNITEEKLREDVLKLQDDKDKYQNAAKESLKMALQDKVEAINKIQDFESSLRNAENECAYFRDVNKNIEQEMQDLLEKNSDFEKDITDLNKKLQEAEEKYNYMVNQAAEEKLDNDNKFEELRKNEEILLAKIEALEADNDFSREQLESLKARYELYKEKQPADEKIEKNGLLSPTEDGLETSGGDSAEKKALIQDLFSEVNRLDQELKRVVEENNKNETSLSLKYQENAEHHTNGDIKSVDYTNQLQAEIQQLKNRIIDYEMAVQSLLCTVTLLQELLSETREHKKIVDSDLIQLKTHFDESQNNFKKLKDELESTERQLNAAKKEVNDKDDEITKLEAEISSVQISEDKDGAPEKNHKDSGELNKLRGDLDKCQTELKSSQNESEVLRKKLADLTAEFEKKHADKKTILELESLCKECALHHARIQSLESEARKCRNVNIQLQADNQLLEGRCTRLETDKVTLENKGDIYWKEQVKSAEMKADVLTEELSKALKEILLIKERFSECNDEKTHFRMERDALSEQVQVLTIRSRTFYIVCLVPMVVLIIAIMAFHSSLSDFTATSDQT